MAYVYGASGRRNRQYLSSGSYGNGRLNSAGYPYYSEQPESISPQSLLQGGITSLANGPGIPTPDMSLDTDPSGALNFPIESGVNATGITKTKSTTPGIDPASVSLGGPLEALMSQIPLLASSGVTGYGAGREYPFTPERGEFINGLTWKDGMTGEVYQFNPSSRQWELEGPPEQLMEHNPGEFRNTLASLYGAGRDRPFEHDGTLFQLMGDGTLTRKVGNEWLPADPFTGALLNQNTTLDNDGIIPGSGTGNDGTGAHNYDMGFDLYDGADLPGGGGDLTGDGGQTINDTLDTLFSMDDLRDRSSQVWDLLDSMGLVNNVDRDAFLATFGLDQPGVSVPGVFDQWAEIIDEAFQLRPNNENVAVNLDTAPSGEPDYNKFIGDLRERLALADETGYVDAWQAPNEQIPYDQREEQLRQDMYSVIRERMGYDPATGEYKGPVGFNAQLKEQMVNEATELLEREQIKRGIYRSPAAMAEVANYLADIDVQDMIYAETKQAEAVDQGMRLAEYMSTEDRARREELLNASYIEEKVRQERANELAYYRDQLLNAIDSRDESRRQWAQLELDRTETEARINELRRQTNAQIIQAQTTALEGKRTDERETARLEAQIQDSKAQAAIMAADLFERIQQNKVTAATGLLGTEYEMHLGELGKLLDAQQLDFSQWMDKILTEDYMNRSLQGQELTQLNSLLTILGLPQVTAGQSLIQALSGSASGNANDFNGAYQSIVTALEAFLGNLGM